MTSTDDAALVDSADDLDALWRAHGPTALRYATVLVGPNDAHDITADAFLRISRTTGWSGIDRPQAYLIRAVTNHARDLHRRRERRWRRDIAAVTASTTTTAEPSIDVLRQIAKLSVQQRAVIFLAYWDDMTEPAIASLLGVSTGTVHRTLVRARAQLRKVLP